MVLFHPLSLHCRPIATQAVMSRKVECVSGKSSDRALLVPDSTGVGTRGTKNEPNHQQIEATGGQKWAQFHFHSANRYLHSRKPCLNNAFWIEKAAIARYFAAGDS